MFNVINGTIYFGKDRVGSSSRCPGFSDYIFEDSPIGRGANGITYRVRHRYLDCLQVVKLYYPVEGAAKKAKLESQKNSNRRISRFIAGIHHGGIYTFPVEIPFAVLENVPRFSTFGEYIAQSKPTNDPKIPQKTLIQLRKSCITWSVDVACSVFRPIVDIHNSGVIHGDLNPGNILIPYDFPETSKKSTKFSEGLDNYVNNRGGYLSCFSVRVIDLGTSMLETTSEEDGIIREIEKIIEIFGKIFQFYFIPEDNRSARWLNISKNDYHRNNHSNLSGNESLGPNVAFALSGDIFLLVLFLNIMNGFIINGTELDHHDLSLLNSVMTGRYSSEIHDVIDVDSLLEWRVVTRTQRRVVRENDVKLGTSEDHPWAPGGFIKWNCVINDLLQLALDLNPQFNVDNFTSLIKAKKAIM